MATEAPIRKVSTLCFIGACETCTDANDCGCQHHHRFVAYRPLTLHELAYSVWWELNEGYQEEHHKNRVYSILIKARNHGLDLQDFSLDQAYELLHQAAVRSYWSLQRFDWDLQAAEARAREELTAAAPK